MWSFNRMCHSKVRLDGKTVVITGANTGIGKETARDLYRRGARVILACRDIAKANAAIEDLKAKPPSKPEREQFNGGPGELVTCKLDLASFASVRECAKNLTDTEANIHILINNAGVMMCPHEKTVDGNEMQFQTNHLSHFLLTLLLLPKMKNSAPAARIVNVSSLVHNRGTIDFDDLNLEKSYTPFKAYCQSKLANILFTRELARIIEESTIDGITVYSLHPGVIHTDIGRHLDITMFKGYRTLFRLISKPFVKSLELGVQTTIHCAVDEEAGKETGFYYKECARALASDEAMNDEIARRLWNESLKMVGLELPDNFADMLSALSRIVASA